MQQGDVRPQFGRDADRLLAALRLADHLDVLLGVQQKGRRRPDDRSQDGGRRISSPLIRSSAEPSTGTGHVVDGRDAEAVADRLVGLLRDREAAAAMGEKGRARVREA
ncbi:hypothetical protein ABZ154_03870 [Streptomyces sp. NPDC006261]|uniref:glycosyltransferase n=1 Tax=Streptomyces sp. NPDC006261 TaxID=3156739 RepID=UPI0033A65955